MSDQNAKALEYGLGYARRTGKTVTFFSAPDPEVIESGGMTTYKFGRRLWLWTAKPRDFDGNPHWRFERTSSANEGANK